MKVRLLQLASPALPIGGFGYSSALEWAIESRQVHDECSAREWIEDALALSPAGFEVPAMIAALRILRPVAAVAGADRSAGRQDDRQAGCQRADDVVLLPHGISRGLGPLAPFDDRGNVPDRQVV